MIENELNLFGTCDLLLGRVQLWIEGLFVRVGSNLFVDDRGGDVGRWPGLCPELLR